MSEPGPQAQPDDNLMDLLVKQSSDGLSPSEQRALDGLDGAVVMAARHDVERAAAAVMLAGLGPLQAPPAALKARLEELARNQTTGKPAIPGPVASPDRPAASVIEPASARPMAAAPRPSATRGNAGWFAAAACLLLALLGWLRTPPAQQAPVAVVEAPPAAIPPPAPTVADERAALLAKADSIKVILSATKDPAAAGVTGDTVWDPATQKGFLHFSGLAANDPAVHQYQLWIFDASRDKRYPIDGGVFDVPANSNEVIIPIRAALPVRQPAAFAVTVEKPGGVVVSARDHVVVLGAAS